VRFVNHQLALSGVPETLTARAIKVAYVFLPFAKTSVHAVDFSLLQSFRLASMSNHQKTAIVQGQVALPMNT
jgi:hypothetical protein